MTTWLLWTLGGVFLLVAGVATALTLYVMRARRQAVSNRPPPLTSAAQARITADRIDDANVRARAVRPEVTDQLWLPWLGDRDHPVTGHVTDPGRRLMTDLD